VRSTAVSSSCHVLLAGSRLENDCMDEHGITAAVPCSVCISEPSRTICTAMVGGKRIKR
jgi:hypothetical protein